MELGGFFLPCGMLCKEYGRDVAGEEYRFIVRGSLEKSVWVYCLAKKCGGFYATICLIVLSYWSESS